MRTAAGSPPAILIVGDSHFAEGVKLQLGMQHVDATLRNLPSIGEALDVFRRDSVDIFVTRLGAGWEGLELADMVRRCYPETRCLLVTDKGEEVTSRLRDFCQRRGFTVCGNDEADFMPDTIAILAAAAQIESPTKENGLDLQ